MFSAGEVFVRLGALFEGREFDKYDRAVAKARSHPDVKTQLKADFDGRGFNLFNKATRDAESGLVKFGSRIPLVQWGALIAGATAAGVAIIQLASALGPLSGALAALPAGATAAAQGIATILFATRGVGEALTATLAAQDTAGKDAISTLQQQRGAAESVRSAEMSLTDAERASKLAEQDLSRARRDSIRELEDRKLAAEGAAQGEEAAHDALVRTRQELRRVQRDPRSTTQDLAEAELRVREAVTGVKQAQLDSNRAQEDWNRAREKGVEGTDRYVSAQRSVNQAHRAERESLRSLRITIRDTNIALAQLSGGTAVVQQAMQNLPPRAQHFVKFLTDLRPRFKALREAAGEGLFPGLETGITSAVRNLPIVQKLFGDTGKALGDLSVEAGEAFGSRGWGRDMEVQGDRNVTTITRLGHAVMSIVEAIRHYTLASGRLQDFLTRGTEAWAKNREESAKAARETGRAADFFDHTITVMKLLSDIGQNVWHTIRNIGDASNDSASGGDRLLRKLRELTAGMEEWTGSAEGQSRIAGFFDAVRAATARVARAVGNLIQRYKDLRSEGKTQLEALSIIMGETISKAVENAVRLMAEHGPRVAKAFVEGFLAADIWGKLFIGGWLLSRLGGRRGIGAVGGRIGGMIADSLAGGLAGKLGGGRIGGPGGVLSKLGERGSSPANPVYVEDVTGTPGGGTLPGSRAPGRGAGALGLLGVGGPLGAFAIGAITVGSIATGMILNKEDRRVIENRTGVKGDRRRAGLEGPDRKTGGITPGFIGDPRAEGERLRQSEDRHKKWSASVQKTVGDVTVTQKKYVADSRQAYTAAGDRLADMRDRTARITKDIKERFGSDTAAARDALAKHYSEAREAAKRQMDRTGVVTEKGLAFIKRLFIREQLLYGASRGEAEASFSQRGSDQSSHKPFSRDGGNVPGAQRGAVVVPGRGDGDKVPVHVGGRLAAMVESGELISVLNKRATAAMMRINRAIPRFAGGGMVRAPGDPDTTGGRDLVNPSIARSVGQWVRRYHADIGYAYDPGHHESYGHNVTGTATDVVPGPGGSWDMLERGLSLLVSRGLTVLYGTNGVGTPYPDHGRGNHAHIEWGSDGAGAFPLQLPKIGRIDVKGLGGPHGSLVEKGLNKVRVAANRRLRRRYMALFGAGGGPGGPIVHGDGNVEKVFAQVARRLSKSRVATLALGEAGYAESGMRDLPGGDASSQGSLQLLASTAAGLGVDPHDEGAVASLFFNRGFYGRGGANTLAAQGLPAHLVAQGVQGSAFSSGSNYAAQEGPARHWMQRFNLQSGGVVWRPGQGISAPGWGGAAAPSGGGGGGGGGGMPPELRVTDDVAGSTPVGGDTLSEVVSNVQSRVADIRGNIRGFTNRLTRLQDDYGRRDRFYDQSEELIVLNPGDPGFSKATAKEKTGFENGPYIDPTALAKRKTELEDLVRMQRERQSLYSKYIEAIANIVKIYRGAQAKLRDLITNKMPKGRREKYRNQIEAFGRAIQGWKGNIRSVRGERADAWLDFRDVLSELNVLTPNAERDVKNTIEGLQGSGGVDEDVAAQLQQAQTKIEALELAGRTLRGAFSAFAGPGDIGAGAGTAWGAVLNPGGTPGGAGPGVPISFAADGTPIYPGGGGPGAGAGQVVIQQFNQMLHPADPEVLRLVASSTVRALGTQPQVVLNRERVDL